MTEADSASVTSHNLNITNTTDNVQVDMFMIKNRTDTNLYRIIVHNLALSDNRTSPTGCALIHVSAIDNIIWLIG
jgi:hypothetical protein